MDFGHQPEDNLAVMLGVQPKMPELVQAGPADPLAFLMAPIAAVSSATGSIIAQTKPAGSAPPAGDQPVATAV